MTSPNHAEYIDLTIYDLNPVDIYQNAVLYARTSLPDWEPRVGTVEDAILQGVSYATSLMVNAVNRLPSSLAEGITKLTGFDRQEATFATGSAVVEVVSNAGVTIPSGTIFAYETIVDQQPVSYTFETTETLTIATGDTTGTVAISGIRAGLYPQLLAGQGLSVISVNTGILTVELDSNIYVGSDSESDSSYFARLAEHFARLSSCLTTARQVTNYIALTYPSITYFHVFDLTDSTDMAYSSSPVAGYFTVVTRGAQSATPSGTVTELLSDLEDKCPAGLSIGHVDLDSETLDVTCIISVSAGYNTTSIVNTVEEYIKSIFSYDAYDYSGQIIGNAVLSKISQIPGVEYVSSFSISNWSGTGSIVDNNLSISNKNIVPLYGTVTVTHL